MGEAVDGVTTFGECWMKAIEAGKKFFGLQDGKECMIGDTYGDAKDETEGACKACSAYKDIEEGAKHLPAPGAANCGGELKMSVYKADDKADFIYPTTTKPFMCY